VNVCFFIFKNTKIKLKTIFKISHICKSKFTSLTYKHLFTLDENITYLNCAAYSPLLKSVTEAGQKGLQLKTNPQNISPKFDFFDHSDQARELLKKILNAPDKDDFAIIPSVSYGMAIVANNLFRLPNILQKTNIVIVAEEFPNNIYTFEKAAEKHNLRLDSISADVFNENWNQKLLNVIDAGTAVVVVPHVHWIHGYVFDLEQISKKCKANGALLVIDGTQSVGAFNFDISLIKPDALIGAFYKWMMGPHSIAYTYLGEFFHDGEPLEESWFNKVNSHVFSDLLNYERAYRPRAQRYNSGEYSHFILTPMIIAAMEQLLAWGTAPIQKHCLTISEPSIAELRALGCKILPTHERASHLISLLLPEKIKLDDLMVYLQTEKIHVSKRDKTIRVSPHLYNSEQDFEKLTLAIKKFIK
jgi:selenocysteine lyase/cysteine desulfurase